MKDSITACLLGTAIGDALGLSCEGLSRERQKKMFPDMEKYHFLLGKGMYSDDTEHTLLVSEALLESGGDLEIFRKNFAWKLRFWIAGLPAGIGFATLRACIKLWLGFSPQKSGVFSAGNGPAMRSPILGVMLGEDPGKMMEFVKASTIITHSDPKAEWGAASAALAAFMASNNNEPVLPEKYLEEISKLLGEEASEFTALMEKVVNSVKSGQSTGDFAIESGLKKGVSGYIYHTMPIVIHSWLSNQGDFKKGLLDVIRCGGDSDTAGAIVGGILGAGIGVEGIPDKWQKNIFEFPRSIEWIKKLGEKLNLYKSEPKQSKAPFYNHLLIYPRNFIFTMTVLTHGFRRMLPPY